MPLKHALACYIVGMLESRKELSLTAHITVYRPPRADRPLPVVVIIPGGSYRNTADREKLPVVHAFMEHGYIAVVLDYTTYVKDTRTDIQRMSDDVFQTYREIRANASEWNANPKRVFVCGFSAGGHLAAIAASRLGRRRIRGVILGYPAMGAEYIRGLNSRFGTRFLVHPYFKLFHPRPEDEVSRRTPPTFIWHTRGDLLVSPHGSIRYAERLLEARIPCELHLFHTGQHALSVATKESARYKFQVQPHVAHWIDLACSWADTL